MDGAPAGAEEGRFRGESPSVTTPHAYGQNRWPKQGDTGGPAAAMGAPAMAAAPPEAVGHLNACPPHPSWRAYGDGRGVAAPVTKIRICNSSNNNSRWRREQAFWM